MSDEPFGFTAGRTKSESHPGWYVSLPHQCDSWDIAGEGEYGWGEEYEVVVAALERFITEAQAALDALRDQRRVDRG